MPRKTETLWCNCSDDESLKVWLPRAVEKAVAVLTEGGTVLGHCLRSKHRMAAFYAALMVQQRKTCNYMYVYGYACIYSTATHL